MLSKIYDRGLILRAKVARLLSDSMRVTLARPSGTPREPHMRLREYIDGFFLYAVRRKTRIEGTLSQRILRLGIGNRT